MRLSAFILNLLTMLMILVPCRDHKVLCINNASISQIHAASPFNNQGDDDCSPLCTCSCCASVSASIYTPEVEGIVAVSPEKKTPIYITPDYYADRSAVWQPPRVG